MKPRRSPLDGWSGSNATSTGHVTARWRGASGCVAPRYRANVRPCSPAAAATPPLPSQSCSHRGCAANATLPAARAPRRASRQRGVSSRRRSPAISPARSPGRRSVARRIFGQKVCRSIVDRSVLYMYRTVLLVLLATTTLDLSIVVSMLSSGFCGRRRGEITKLEGEISGCWPAEHSHHWSHEEFRRAGDSRCLLSTGRRQRCEYWRDYPASSKSPQTCNNPVGTPQSSQFNVALPTSEAVGIYPPEFPPPDSSVCSSSRAAVHSWPRLREGLHKHFIGIISINYNEPIKFL